MGRKHKKRLRQMSTRMLLYHLEFRFLVFMVTYANSELNRKQQHNGNFPSGNIFNHVNRKLISNLASVCLKSAYTPESRKLKDDFGNCFFALE